MHVRVCAIVLGSLRPLQAGPAEPRAAEPRAADPAPTYSCDTEEIRALARELSQDASVAEVGCAESAEQTREHNDLLKRFVRVAQLREGSLRIEKTCSTVEGDPIVQYLIAEGGAVTLVTDSTADRYGPRQVCRARIESVELGYLDEQEGDGGPRFVPVAGNARADRQYVVRCLPQEWYF